MRIQFKLAIQAFLLLWFLTGVTTYAEQPVRVMITSAGKPWSYLDEQGKPQGISRALIESVFDAMEVPASYQGLIYTRALHTIETGRGDVMALTIATSQTLQPPPNTVVTPAPVGKIPLSAYKLTTRDIAINTPADLSQYKVGLVRAEKTPAGAAEKVFYYPRNEFLFRALAQGKIDIALGALYFEHVWTTKFNVKVEPLFIIDKLNVYMAFSKKTLGDKAAVLCKKYFLTNQQLIKDGTIEQLLVNMGAPDLVPHLKIFDDHKSPECIANIDNKALTHHD
jgi:ABC-type amino acid transport substrate-binding protein